MAMLADGLLLIAALTAATYCVVLSRRLSRLSGLDEGLGKAIVDLSERSEAMKNALAEARGANEAAARDLRGALREAEAVEARLNALTAAASTAADEREAFGESAPSDEPETHEPGFENAPPAYDEAVRGGTDPLREAMNVIDRAPPGEEDEAFANRLVDALSTLQTNGARR
ncbi:MAG: DUF6468 domain-containing protein [Pseudomonadota bacterium]